MINLQQGDCLELMKNIPDGSVDMILCDLPYGITSAKWDVALPFGELWAQYKRIIKDNGAIVLFSQQPFASQLICANQKMFRYEWIWNKHACAGFLNANKMPLRVHENILVFYKTLPTYNPQFWYSKPYEKIRRHSSEVYGGIRNGRKPTISLDGKRYPIDILDFPRESSTKFEKKVFHPTQKPVALLEYLIKTYTNEGELVLDNTMGSGSTGVACVNTNRRFIGIEKDDKYFEIAQNRIEQAQKEQKNK